MKRIIIILLFVQWTTILYAQIMTNHISGKISGQQFVEGSRFCVMLYYQNNLGIYNVPDTILSTTIDSNGMYKMDFAAPSSLFYLGMGVYNGEIQIDLKKDFFLTPYLCQLGDSVTLNINISPSNDKWHPLNNKSWFTGKGAEKYNAQYLINHYNEPREAIGTFYTGFIDDYDDYLKVNHNVALLHRQYRLNIADAFKKCIPENILIRIKQNIDARAKYWFVKTYLYSSYVIADNNKEQQSVKNFISLPNEPNELFKRKNELTGTLGYGDFILLTDELKYRIQHQISQKRNKSLNGKEYGKKYFDWMYNNLKTNYIGLLRESLITRWLTDPATLRYYFDYVSNVIPEAKNMVTLTANRKSLENITLQSKGKKAFDFKFIDKTGKTHTLKDYAGKILVLDFWFTGCHGCTQIPPVMKPIVEKFKTKKNVVFLSISIDQNMEIWEKGLKSGLYSLPDQVHLKTIHHGRIDPFIIYHNITAYPKLMVIGKEGQLLVANPVDPRTDKGQDIINKIEQELKN